MIFTFNYKNYNQWEVTGGQGNMEAVGEHAQYLSMNTLCTVSCDSRSSVNS